MQGLKIHIDRMRNINGDICCGAAILCKQQPNLARFKVTIQFEATNFMKTADRENCENTKEK